MATKKLNLDKYQELCKQTAKVPVDKTSELANYGLGVAGEAGDLAGCIKKTLYHNNDQVLGTRENIGDTMWYLAMICNFYGWNFEEILSENIEKLKKRFPLGFSDLKAGRDGTRKDWNEV
ncbi:MAG: nucleoside triphosphate pyrophosphohydrolase family protein [Candidatus Uhrbacteria bacterium]|nr:nucleoside triphosphate pyrophosphohydrolase family protein [Candidatus Uhrbacteria bacterium]